MDLAAITSQLKDERDRLASKLDRVNLALQALTGHVSNRTRPRRQGKLSAKGLANIRAAQKARWARVKGPQKVVPIASRTGKRTMPAFVRRKIAAAQKKRWVKVRRQKKKRGNDRAIRL